MARLCGLSNDKVQSDRLAIALKFAKSWNAHVILKGFHTVLATPDGRAFVNTTGNPGMAKGGSGDVLTGILAGMTAQFGPANWERALALGIYLHGLSAAAGYLPDLWLAGSRGRKINKPTVARPTRIDIRTGDIGQA